MRVLKSILLQSGAAAALAVVAGCSSSGDGASGKGSGGTATVTSGGSAGAAAAAQGAGATGGSSAGQGGPSGSGGTSSSVSAGGTSSSMSSGGTSSTGPGTGGTTSTGGAGTAGDAAGMGGSGPTGGDAGMKSAMGGKSAGGSGGRGSAGSGMTGSAGAASGTTTCATAAENDAATLTCPAGQIIDSVVFASFGTPTGSCGSFAASSCDAAASQSTIEAACVGRSSCSVTAANGTFGGDPCHGTTKKLDVEVSCVPGVSTQPDPSTSPYKGVANSPAAQLSALGSTWCYNWGASPKSTDCADPGFVPMIWGASDVKSLDAIAKAGYTTVLGFNEPNKSDQSNLAVADAIALWPEVTANANIRVSSPAVSDDGRSWLEDFMTQAKQQGLRVDFIAMHWYGWNAGSCTASQLEGAVKWASQWGLPVWITEFGCMGSSNPDEQTVLDFFNAAIPMLAKHPLVERYAWYPWNTYNDLYTSGSSPMMTALGQAFLAAPQYRQ